MEMVPDFPAAPYYDVFSKTLFFHRQINHRLKHKVFTTSLRQTLSENRGNTYSKYFLIYFSSHINMV